MLALEKAYSNLDELRTCERLRQVYQAQGSLREDHDTFKTDKMHQLSELQKKVPDLMKDNMECDGGNDGATK